MIALYFFGIPVASAVTWLTAHLMNKRAQRRPWPACQEAGTIEMPEVTALVVGVIWPAVVVVAGLALVGIMVNRLGQRIAALANAR